MPADFTAVEMEAEASYLFDMRNLFHHFGPALMPAFLAAASLTVSADPAAAACGGRVQTGRGTSALALAQRCGTTLQELRRANPLINTNRLNGQVVEIPQPAPQYIPDSMARGAPPASSVLPPVPHGHPTIRPLSGQPRSNGVAQAYTIHPGDTLSGIAARADVPLDRLIAANPGVDPRRLAVGQTIAVPSVD